MRGVTVDSQVTLVAGRIGIVPTGGRAASTVGSVCAGGRGADTHRYSAANGCSDIGPAAIRSAAIGYAAATIGAATNRCSAAIASAGVHSAAMASAGVHSSAAAAAGTTARIGVSGNGGKRGDPENERCSKRDGGFA